MEELKQCRLQQRNISVTVDKLTQCLPGESLASSKWDFFVTMASSCEDSSLLTCLCLHLSSPLVLEMDSKLREQMKSKR